MARNCVTSFTSNYILPPRIHGRSRLPKKAGDVRKFRPSDHSNTATPKRIIPCDESSGSVLLREEALFYGRCVQVYEQVRSHDGHLRRSNAYKIFFSRGHTCLSHTFSNREAFRNKSQRKRRIFSHIAMRLRIRISSAVKVFVICDLLS